MSPEDCYWLINNMIDRFPGLMDGESVSGSDLVEWVSDQVNRDSLLAQIANGSVHKESNQDLAEVKWSCPVCATPFVPEIFSDGDVIKCYVCETTWRADPLEEDE